MRTTIPMNDYTQVGPLVKFVPPLDPGAETQDLVTYLASLLPENVDPLHVVLGIGMAFAGVVGGVALFRFLRRSSTGVIEPPKNAAITDRQQAYDKDLAFPKLPPGEVPKGVLLINQCPRGRKTPCIAPYPLKLETFLRVAGINYEMDSGSIDRNNNDPSADSKMVVLDMENLPESSICMKNLSQKFGIDLSSHLSPRDKAIEKAFSHLLDQKIYWGVSLYRWVYDGARSIDKVQYLPDNARESIPSVARTVEHAAWHHGIGKRTPTEVVEDVIKDLAALSIQLGSKSFFLSDTSPTELDCTAFAMLTQMLWTMDGPFHVAVSDTYKNLADFCWRMRTLYWPDWNQCLYTDS